MFSVEFKQREFEKINIIPDWPQTCVLAQSWFSELEKSQFWSTEEYRHYQMQRIKFLLQHAVTTVPVYKAKYRSLNFSIDEKEFFKVFTQLPILSKAELQISLSDNVSSNIPVSHGSLSQSSTSGSTGQPLTIKKTRLARIVHHIFTMRDHCWHQRDFSQQWAGIIYVPEGKPKDFKSWGMATDFFCNTNIRSVLDMRNDVELQAQWLVEKSAAYLTINPTNLQALIEYCQQEKIRIPNMQQISTFGEPVSQQLRELCQEVWQVPIKDIYSTAEIGNIAFQCPEHEHYHVQEEHLLVEVLNERGDHCQPGEIGGVYVTTLYNYASPLIRYDTGDFAEVGELCDCGRQSLVLKRIMGRSRNMLRLANGKRFFPVLGYVKAAEIGDIKQFQLVQKSYSLIEARLVVGIALTLSQEQALKNFWSKTIGYDFEYQFSYVSSISRGATGKREEFICEVV